MRELAQSAAAPKPRGSERQPDRRERWFASASDIVRRAVPAYAVQPGHPRSLDGFARACTNPMHTLDLWEVLASLIVAGRGATLGGPHRTSQCSPIQVPGLRAPREAAWVRRQRAGSKESHRSASSWSRMCALGLRLALTNNNNSATIGGQPWLVRRNVLFLLIEPATRERVTRR